LPKSRVRARADKSSAIDELVEKLQGAEIAVLTEYRGLSVSELQDLRGRLRPVGVEYVVAKNTLARFAAERTGRTTIVDDLVGPTAIAFGSDPVATAKALQDFGRTNRIFVLKAALLGDRRIDPREVEQLATLPPADVLRGRVFGMIVSPLQSTVTVLSAPLASLARLLEARRAQLEEQGSEAGGDGMASIDELVQSLGDLKVLDLANLVKRLEQEWGVSAAAVAAPMAVAAPTGDGAAAAAPAEAPAAPEAAPEEPKKAPPAVVSGDAQTGKGETTTQDLTRLQQTVARRMAESKATAPDFVLNVDVDMEEAVDLRKRLKAAAAEGQPVPSFNDFVVKAAALALVDFPRANGAYRDGKFELYSRVNVGVAVAGQDALVVPTVFDADRKSLGQIAKESRALAERVRAGAITPPELSSGTFTVSNLGMFGIQSFVAVINPPQAAILAVGAMHPTPVVRDGEVVVRNIMRLTLACDHRILYGADAAEFLGRIRERLENPLQLAL
jgi:pyruvate dehydrogenase E2 component (dihydrolipoamide acetyltransferase)